MSNTSKIPALFDVYTQAANAARAHGGTVMDTSAGLYRVSLSGKRWLSEADARPFKTIPARRA